MAVKGAMSQTQMFGMCHCDLDLGDMTLVQGHDTPLGHGQQLCEILSKSNTAVRSYGPDTDFRYLCACDLGDMTLVQGHDTPLGHGQISSRSDQGVRSYDLNTM